MASFQGNFADTVLFCADAAELKEGDCNWEQKRICQGLSAARERLFILGHAKSLKVCLSFSTDWFLSFQFRLLCPELE